MLISPDIYFKNSVSVAKSCITVCYTYSLRMAIFLNTDISQGSVATRLVCGGVFVHNCYKFPTESNSQRILKIGQYLVKLWARVRCLVFFDSRCSAADITTPLDASLLPPLPWPFVTSDMTRLGVGHATCVFLMCRQWADKPRFLKTVVTVMLIRKAITKRFLRLTFWLVVSLLILIWAIRSTSLLLSSASSSLFCYVRFILFSLLSHQL